MSKLLPEFILYQSPPDAPIGGSVSSSVPTQSMDKDDMADFMKEDTDEKEILDIDSRTHRRSADRESDTKDEKDLADSKEDDETETEEDELKELEKELEGPTDEQLELVTPVRRKEILKKYPELFKDFPYLEKAYYREQQFTEILPTIADARQAVEKSQILDRFESDVSNGNIQGVLASAKENNPNAFNKIADNYMQTLASIDEKAYHHVLGNIMKHTIVAMSQEGRRSSNDVLISAAQILNQFIFASSEFTPPTTLSRESDGDRTIAQQQYEREQEFSFRQLTNSVEDTNTKVNNTLKNTIDANIDPKNSMTDYVRKNASREALETLERLIMQDNRFKTLADKLWERAIQEGYSKTSVDRVKSAYLAKAKSLLPTVIKKARNEALRGLGRTIEKDDDDSKSSVTREHKGPVTAGRPRSNSGGKITKASDIPKGMRTLDFLMSD